jgi:hypothetical protein
MQFRSRNILTLFLAVALVAAGCRSETERRLGQSTRRELELGRAAAGEWQRAVQRPEISQTNAIAAGYLERLRLGLGSPFRLVDYAYADPRLSDSVRTRLAFALLDRTLSGAAYDVDAAALDRASRNPRTSSGTGSRHLELIDNAIEDAKDPLVAESAIRLAYTMAAAEGLVSHEAIMLAASVAALRVDRSLAGRDAAQLLKAANPETTALELLREWRSQRRFLVERPRIEPLNAADELTAIRMATRMLETLRATGRKIPNGEVATAVAEALVRPRLSDAAVEALDLAEASLAAPPVTPVVIAARQLAREAPLLPWLTREQRQAQVNFANHAVNEESFVVEHARLSRTPVGRTAAARAAVQAAVALRAYSQETVWFPGMDGPSQRDLLEQYRLASITFDRSVRASWRPYYRKMLLSSLDDMHRVLPTLSLRGLRIHFGSTPENADALAVHEPGKRRLLLPPLTSAGTLAHEIAHDIDWQVALRHYRIRGDYATDRAARDRNDALAAQVRTLASASLPGRVANARLSAHARRPAEIFARNVDWYVAVSLAREGRRNGYLSSVQDELITGYGTVRAPDVSGAAGDALMTILSQLAPLYRDQHDAFRALYGSTRSPRAYDLVRRIVEAPVERRWSDPFEDELRQLAEARDLTLQGLDQTACASAWNASTELQTARRDLVLLTTEARARGLAMQRLERGAPRSQRASLISLLYRGPIPIAIDSVAAAIATPLADAVRTMTAKTPLVSTTPFNIRAPRTCTTTLGNLIAN